ncbi:MAG TPA: hypothetical protein VIJ41_11725 [Candidatus Nanopelagicales bacterium]
MDPTITDADSALESAAATLRAFGLTDGRTSYAGLRLDHRRQATVIYRVPNPEFDRQVLELSGSPTVVILEDAAHARIDLEAARDRVWDLPGAEDITGLSVPIDGSTVKVAFDGDAAAAQAWMDIAIPGLVTVEQADPRLAPGPHMCPR